MGSDASNRMDSDEIRDIPVGHVQSHRDIVAGGIIWDSPSPHGLWPPNPNRRSRHAPTRPPDDRFEEKKTSGIFQGEEKPHHITGIGWIAPTAGQEILRQPDHPGDDVFRQIWYVEGIGIHDGPQRRDAESERPPVPTEHGKGSAHDGILFLPLENESV